MLLSCGLGHIRVSALPALHKAVAFRNYSILSRSRVHIPGNAPCISSHKPPAYTVMQHSPCLPDIQTSSSSSPSRYQSNSSAALPTELLPAQSHTQTLLALLSFSILSTWPNHRRTHSPIFSSTPFVIPHNYLFLVFGTLSILLTPSRHIIIISFEDKDRK